MLGRGTSTAPEALAARPAGTRPTSSDERQLRAAGIAPDWDQMVHSSPRRGGSVPPPHRRPPFDALIPAPPSRTFSSLDVDAWLPLEMPRAQSPGSTRASLGSVPTPPRPGRHEDKDSAQFASRHPLQRIPRKGAGASPRYGTLEHMTNWGQFLGRPVASAARARRLSAPSPRMLNDEGLGQPPRSPSFVGAYFRRHEEPVVGVSDAHVRPAGSPSRDPDDPATEDFPPSRRRSAPEPAYRSGQLGRARSLGAFLQGYEPVASPSERGMQRRASLRARIGGPTAVPLDPPAVPRGPGPESQSVRTPGVDSPGPGARSGDAQGTPARRMRDELGDGDDALRPRGSWAGAHGGETVACQTTTEGHPSGTQPGGEMDFPYPSATTPPARPRGRRHVPGPGSEAPAGGTLSADGLDPTGDRQQPLFDRKRRELAAFAKASSDAESGTHPRQVWRSSHDTSIHLGGSVGRDGPALYAADTDPRHEELRVPLGHIARRVPRPSHGDRAAEEPPSEARAAMASPRAVRVSPETLTPIGAPPVSPREMDTAEIFGKRLGRARHAWARDRAKTILTTTPSAYRRDPPPQSPTRSQLALQSHGRAVRAEKPSCNGGDGSGSLARAPLIVAPLDPCRVARRPPPQGGSAATIAARGGAAAAPNSGLHRSSLPTAATGGPLVTPWLAWRARISCERWTSRAHGRRHREEARLQPARGSRRPAGPTRECRRYCQAPHQARVPRGQPPSDRRRSPTDDC